MTRTTVSFVIPTLNRGRYVVRAVNSCLSAAAAVQKDGVDVQVIVLDSMSDDGSWELLTQSFQNDMRVVLARNARGLGPTRSWLDGAQLVTGEFATFLWSDDYISPDFLTLLLPSLRNGADMAMGNGVVRDIDDDMPLPVPMGAFEAMTGDGFLRRHLGLSNGWALPVSPAVALFTRAVFDRWIAAVEAWCGEPGVRQSLLWKRAIGPDLMLFMAAGLGPANQIAVADNAVAQFSSHAQSITVSSSTLPLRVGYWLAKWWAMQQAARDRAPVAVPGLARLIVQGRILTAMMRRPSGKAAIAPDLSASFRNELRDARSLLFELTGTMTGKMIIGRSALALAWRLGRRAVGR